MKKSNSETNSNYNFFEENEKQVNKIVCKYLAWSFFTFPVMLLINATGLFHFAVVTEITLAIFGLYCTLSPMLLSKICSNQKVIKYYSMTCVILIICYMATQYHVGIYITLILASIISCLYFDKVYTIQVTIASYIGFLISYYIRCIEIRDTLYPTEELWETYIPLALGFTIEYVVSFVALYCLAKRSQILLNTQKTLLEASNKREMTLKNAVDASNDILFDYNVQENIYEATGTIYGWKKQDVHIENYTDYVEKSGYYTDDYILFLHHITYAEGTGEENIQKEIYIEYDEDSFSCQMWLYVEAVVKYNDEGKAITIIGKIRNITEEKLAELSAEEAKQFDALTGMYHFVNLRNKVLGAEKSDTTHQIMLIHIKNYNEIARMYGEVYRDMIILNIAEMIKKAAEGEGIYLCRLAFDTFVIYIEDVQKADGRRIRQEVTAGLRDLYIGERSIDSLDYDFGYYLGEESFDEMIEIAVGYIDAKWKKDVSGKQNVPQTTLESLRVASNANPYHSLAEGQKREAGKLFINNISALLIGAKDSISAVHIVMDRIAKFYELDSIRIYEFSTIKKPVGTKFSWSKDAKVKKECETIPLTVPVAEFFVENFANARVVDNTLGAFKDFVRQYGETPLLIEGYSSLLCPFSIDGQCQTLFIYDIAKTNYSWSEDMKSHLIELSKILGNHLLLMADNYLAQSRDDFFACLSHEIRMPINAVMETTEIARMDLDNPERIRNCLDIIDISADNMIHVVDNIMDISKIELASLKLKREIFKLEDILGRVEKNAINRVEKYDISLTIERRFHENLLRGDEKRLFQILYYLVENALKYTQENGKVHVLVEELGKIGDEVSLYFMVEDDGVGVSEQKLENIFEMFRMNEIWDNNSIENSIGMDMIVCYRLIELMGGELKINSKPGKSTSVSFVLKFEVPPKEKMIEFLSRKKQEKDELLNLKGMNVLVAEDNPLNAEIMQKLLERYGANVTLAENGIICIDLFQQSPVNTYDFILMDVVMPVANGHKAARAIRSLEREDATSVPIIALSANAFVRDVKKSLEAGMNAHLIKPIRMEEVIREVKKCIKNNRKRE